MEDKILKLRSLLQDSGMDAILVPYSDEFRCHFPASYAQRLHWLTGFTGSAGMAIVTRDKVALFVDSRYTNQAQHQVDSSMEVFNSGEVKPWEWLAKKSVIAVDGWLHTSDELSRYASHNIVLVDNWIDKIWLDRPQKSPSNMVVHPIQYAGKNYTEKIQELRCWMLSNKIDMLVITDPSSTAWLLNIRGGDVPYVPIALVYAVVSHDTVQVYGDVNITDELLNYFYGTVVLHTLSEFLPVMEATAGLNVGIDANRAPYVVESAIQSNNTVRHHSDPCLWGRGVKNHIEQDGMRQCHIWDGVALAKFMFWFEHDECKDECHAVEKLAEFRSQQPGFQQNSFPTIAGYGPNGAIIHYKPLPEDCLKIEGNNLFLLDSGGQYLNGTTDVTRVLLKGSPSNEHVRYYTAVLQGYIDLSMAQFPCGVTGVHLDALARMPLWRYGKDYAHSTGHGVGSYLDVHEGPHCIGQSLSGHVPLEPGMVVSNEPGYYKNGEYGIRLESLLLVTGDDTSNFLRFETLTMAIFESDLIDLELLSAAQLRWLSDYHQKIYLTLVPYLEENERIWLYGKISF